MGLSTRYFLVEDDGSITTVSLRSIQSLLLRGRAWPEYSGCRLRLAEMVVDLEDRRPKAIRRGNYFFLQLDASGRVDREHWDRNAQLSVESAIGAVASLDNNVIGGGVFAKRILNREFYWKPSHDVVSRIGSAILRG